MLVLVLVVGAGGGGGALEGEEEEEEGDEERPVNVLARNGRRDRAHVGPCSWMEAVGVKYLDRVSEGGDPAMKAEMKAWVWRASGEGSGGEAVDMVLGILLLLCVVGIADWRDECSSSVLIIVVAVQ